MKPENRTRFALLAVFVAAAIALVLWWQSSDQPERRAETQAPDEGAQKATGLSATAPPTQTEAVEPAAIQLLAAEIEEVAADQIGSIAGRVVNWGTGRGVAGAEVTFSFAGTTASVNAGADGAFAWTPPAAGRYELAVVSAEGYLPFAPDLGESPISVVARPGLAIKGLAIYLTPHVDYRGRVVDPAGNPVADAKVSLLGVGGGERALIPIRTEYVSDADGRFVFHAPDNTVLQAEHPGFAAGRAVLDGPAQVSHELEIALRPKGAPAMGGARVAGRVVTEQGAPIAGAWVYAMHAAADPVRSGADGSFELVGLDPGGVAVTASHDDYATASEFAEAGARDIVIALVPGAVIRGRVVDGQGEAVPAFTVVVMQTRGMRSFVVAQRSMFDAHGRFEVGGLRPGEYAVIATAAGHAPSPQVAARASTTDAPEVTLTLAAGGKIVGRVIDAASKQPLAMARVSIEGTLGAGTSAVPLAVSVVTTDDGRFELAGVAPGVRSINVAAYQHHVRIVSSLRVAEGQTVGPIEVALTPTAEGEQPRVEVAGIGVAIAPGDDGLIVNRVIPEGGAAEAGIVEGDVILAIERAAVVELGFDNAIQRIRGPEGTTVSLTVRRGTGEVAEIVATRRRIRV